MLEIFATIVKKLNKTWLANGTAISPFNSNSFFFFCSKNPNIPGVSHVNALVMKQIWISKTMAPSEHQIIYQVCHGKFLSSFLTRLKWFIMAKCKTSLVCPLVFFCSPELNQTNTVPNCKVNWVSTPYITCEKKWHFSPFLIHFNCRTVEFRESVEFDVF